MALYEELKGREIYGGIHEAIRNGVLPPMDLDGIIRPNFYIDPKEIWVHSKHDIERQCGKWNRIYFPFFKFIPKGCRNCWKVTMKPRTLKQAMGIMMLQEKMDLPSKTGMEMRPYTGGQGGFSSFWYAPLSGGLEGARKLWVTVKEALIEEFGEGEVDVPILKRGCTEMELTFPKSSEWDKYAEKAHWDDTEQLLDKHIMDYKGPERQPTIMKTRSVVLWIEWAFEHRKVTGDYSYRDYIEKDVPEITPIEQYNQSIHSNKDYQSSWETEDGTDNNRPDDA